eukprot:GHVT01064681.1.p2 GENE.GHVT01064681.1~~GHVT01064681.1.p2  ORF type:complete len:117 (+),score=10.92 GHVT01064681.1:856-1206(+)
MQILPLVGYRILLVFFASCSSFASALVIPFSTFHPESENSSTAWLSCFPLFVFPLFRLFFFRLVQYRRPTSLPILTHPVSEYSSTTCSTYLSSRFSSCSLPVSAFDISSTTFSPCI